jgi:hypothetical protein
MVLLSREPAGPRLVPAIRHVAFATREVATFVVTLSRSQATAASESKQNVCAVRLRLVDGFVECDSHLEQQQQRNDALHVASCRSALPSNLLYTDTKVDNALRKV